MTNGQKPAWLPMVSAERDGRRILVTVRGGEQGPAEVDTVRWASPRGSSERCWIAADTGPDSLVTYEDDELVAWMPLPQPPSAHAAVEEAGEWPEPALESDFEEEAGSGI
ncbi:hypothetical protein [Aurantimonas sp. VKM B-3413]|uniref:hypothetical protein n=1 Tax=Aurantimonas sp. VKM B-3413 TaxID=2779401 RepID=UPI001E4956F7|nr:hypothetical protein [Aurantimonas sp. VKM B-3413]MCB8838513.1 hypothetical protein [Aurantimonas sp. VKM B-3413]